MTLTELVTTALTKTEFTTIQKYIDFTLHYLDFISDQNNIQAIIVSQNENHYQFIQYKEEASFKVTRPLNTRLMLSRDDFDSSTTNFLNLLSDIRIAQYNTPEFRALLNNYVYTIQQSIGSSLDAYQGNSNSSRKINGDLFERLIRLMLQEIGVECTSGVVMIPVKIDDEVAFKMSYQHDLIIKNGEELKAIGSVKTSSKDRMDKIFIDKFLYSKLTDTTIPHFAVFLNDVQRKNTKREGEYGINSTFLPGHFKGYTIKLNPLDGVYYCDIRPSMVTENILKDQIKTFDHLLFTDIWEFI